MKKQNKQTKKSLKGLWKAVCFLGTFCLWTVAVKRIDVQPIGPLESEVGFSTLNGFFHDLTGVNWLLYGLTDWLSIIPIALVLGFAILGLRQWMRRKKLGLVDGDILALGGFYALVLLAYLLFEIWEINYRPVLINGVLETSYPSSTTMLMLCVMPTSAMQLHSRIKNKTARQWGLVILLCFTAFMVIGRILSGVQWITDIVGGALLSGALMEIYRWFLYFNKSTNCD